MDGGVDDEDDLGLSLADAEGMLPEVADNWPPPQMQGAPQWALYLVAEQRRDRHAARNRDFILDQRLTRLTKTVTAVRHSLGSESPDGVGGTGVVGEVKRHAVSIENLKNERNFVRGALAAVAGAGTLIVYGFSAWVKSIVEAIHK